MILGTVGSFVLGAICGSFAGVVAERLYTGQSWSAGRSRCSSCRTTLGVLDLIPVLSFLAVRGRCRHCSSRIPRALLITETVFGAVFAGAYVSMGLSVALGIFFVAVILLGIVVLYDVRHTIVPVPLSLSLFVVSLVYMFLSQTGLSAIGGALLTAGCIGLFFLILHAGSGGRAMGLGDAPIAFSLSLLVAPYAFSGLLFSFWIGAVVGIVILVLRRGGSTMSTEVPFVPFLALGYLLAFFVTWNPLTL